MYRRLKMSPVGERSDTFDGQSSFTSGRCPGSADCPAARYRWFVGRRQSWRAVGHNRSRRCGQQMPLKLKRRKR